MRSQSYLQSHVDAKHNKIVFKCDYCSYQSKWKSNLYTHKKNPRQLNVLIKLSIPQGVGGFPYLFLFTIYFEWLPESQKNFSSLIKLTSSFFIVLLFFFFQRAEAEDCWNVFVFLWLGNSSDFPRGLISQRMKLTFLILFREKLFYSKYQVLKIYFHPNCKFSL